MPFDTAPLVCPDRDKMFVANKTGHLFKIPLGTICLSYFS